MSKALTYWWKKYKIIKDLLQDYMKDTKIKTETEAIENLLKENRTLTLYKKIYMDNLHKE